MIRPSAAQAQCGGRLSGSCSSGQKNPPCLSGRRFSIRPRDMPTTVGGGETVKETDMADQPGVIPHLIVNDAAAALEFYKKALGATEILRMPADDGKRLLHAE